MKKHKNLILLLLITFLRSVFLWMSKFFLRFSLKEDNRSLEEIAGYLSLGSAFSYLIWWAITYAFRKKWIMIISAIAIISCLIYWYTTNYFPLQNFAIIIIVMGIFYWLWLTIKWILTTTEIMESWFSESKINASLNIAIFLWLLFGAYWGFQLYESMQWLGVIGIIIVVLLATILICFTSYDKVFKKRNLYKTIRINIPNIFASIQRYFKYLIIIWVLRAVSTAVWQKMLEIWIDIMNQWATKWILIIVVSMIWAVLWHIASTLIKKNKNNTIKLLSILLAVSTIFFPTFLSRQDTYIFMSIYSTYLWFVFWIIVNILEWKFYHQIWRDNRKEFWSAAYWVIMSISMFLIMIWWDFASKQWWLQASFIVYGIAIALVVPFIKKLK